MFLSKVYHVDPKVLFIFPISGTKPFESYESFEEALAKAVLKYLQKVEKACSEIDKNLSPHVFAKHYLSEDHCKDYKERRGEIIKLAKRRFGYNDVITFLVGHDFVRRFIQGIILVPASVVYIKASTGDQGKNDVNIDVPFSCSNCSNTAKPPPYLIVRGTQRDDESAIEVTEIRQGRLHFVFTGVGGRIILILKTAYVYYDNRAGRF
ncbi:hypothetical protein D6810_01595 [Candidatus Dojkabacteria bacterium]|uniref:Uncharacterized protein n=1 Tax=Candidatus Dojkabacteria bacterium TaxID=2099670 RepID=A0A3M0YZQ7_9BACT|nr:MAG: hypothetical protein D6810_01595 [Candidatus Dojkabacteria bacterium]